MGIEYQHFLIPKDPHIDVTDQQIESIINTLKDFGFWKSEPAVTYITSDGLLSEGKSSNGWIYQTGTTVESVATFGESKYSNVSPEERYLSGIFIVFGKNKKIHFSDNEVEVSVNCDLTEVEVPYNQPFYQFTSDEIDDDDVDIYIKVDGDFRWFKGWWKFAIMFDFGKDIPIWSKKLKMDNRKIIDEIELATGISFEEIGNHY